MLLMCKQILAKKYKSNIQISDLIFYKNTIKFMWYTKWLMVAYKARED